MAITSGTHAVGSLAAWNALPAAEQALYTNRYDNFRAAAVDINSFTGNMELVQIDTVSETLLCQFIQAGQQMQGFTLTIRSNNPHNGNPNAGHKIYLTTNAAIFSLVSGAGAGVIGSGTIILKDLYFVITWATTNPVTIDGDGTTAVENITIENLMIDGGNLVAGYGIIENYGAGVPLAGERRYYNCKIWGCKGGIYSYVLQAIIENCTVYGTAAWAGNYGFRVNGIFTVITKQGVLRNNVAVGFTQDYRSDLTVGPPLKHRFNAYNNASGDDSLSTQTWELSSGNITGIVAANEFESLVDTDDEFLFLKEGTASSGFSGTPIEGKAPLKVKFRSGITFNDGTVSLGEGGTAPTYATEDIAGNERPGDDETYSIGCHEEQFILI